MTTIKYRLRNVDSPEQSRRQAIFCRLLLLGDPVAVNLEVVDEFQQSVGHFPRSNCVSTPHELRRQVKGNSYSPESSGIVPQHYRINLIHVHLEGCWLFSLTVSTLDRQCGRTDQTMTNACGA